MEFWGIEVKPGVPVKCDPGSQKYLHLSLASFGEIKKEKSNDAVLSLKIGDQKLVIGILSAENAPQISFDLVFEKEFELSHNGKTSVHFCGYKASMEEEDRPGFSDSEEESEEELLLPANGKPEAKQVQPKPAANKANAAKTEPSSAKPKAQAGPSKKEKLVEDQGDDDDSDEDDSNEDDSDENVLGAGDESGSEDVDSDEDDDEEDESSEEEATPKKVEAGIKRAAESASKTPAEKKAKLVTPAGQKTGADAKKGVHVATPYPSKQAGKTPATNDKLKQQTPKSGGQVSCKSCSKSFNSDNALQSHTKAKHSGK